MELQKLATGEISPTKKNAEAIGQQMAESIRETGYILQSLTTLRAAKLAIDAALENLELDILEELDKHPNGKATINGAKLETAETGVKYDYSGCPKWSAAKEREDSAAAERKERETFLKALREPVADLETGEVINPPIRTSKPSYKVNLQNK